MLVVGGRRLTLWRRRRAASDGGEAAQIEVPSRWPEVVALAAFGLGIGGTWQRTLGWRAEQFGWSLAKLDLIIVHHQESLAALVIWAFLAITLGHKLMAGSTKNFKSVKPLKPDVGSRRNQTATIRINIKASQKPGIDTAAKDSTLTVRSNKDLGRCAASTPRGNPIIPKDQTAAAKNEVVGKRFQNRHVAGNWKRRGLKKSK